MNENKEGFASGVISIMLSQGIIKILGLIYSMYLINKEGFGDKGNAIYIAGYQVYVLFLTISSIGVPNSVSKLIAEKIAINDYNGANKVLKISLLIFGIIGFLGSVVLYIGAKKISNNYLLIPESEYSLIALSPSIFFVAISSVIRGYFNGISQFSKTAKSQTIEQIFKSILTIVFVEVICFKEVNTIAMASIANFATTCAIFISFVYIFFVYKNLRKVQKLNELRYNCYKSDSSIKILKKVFAVSIPITLSAVLGSLSKNIDSLTVVRILTPILGESVAKLKYGVLSSKVDMLTVMPLSFNLAFSTALIPEISYAVARSDQETINKKLSFSLLVTSLIAFPSIIGLSLYSNQILALLFPNSSNGGDLLKISAFCIGFMSFTQTIGGTLHGIGKTKVTVFAILIGMIVKLIVNIVLIPINNIYEKGAVIGNVISSMCIFFIMWNALIQNLKLNFKLKEIIIKPIIATLIMGTSSYFLYNILMNLKIGNTFSILLVIIFAIIVYIILIFLMKIFSKNQLFLLPNGKKIYNFLKKIKIYQ